MSELLIEFLEIVINQIIHLRRLYPSQIFRKQKAFGIPVFISLYPPLNLHIKNVLSETMMLINTNRLKKVEIRLYNEDKVFESFFIAINDQEANQEGFENELMNCIVSLEKRCKTFVKLPKDCKFKVLLYTLLYDFSDTSKSEDFIWIKDNQKPVSGSIIPITMHSHSNSIEFYVEQPNER